MLTGHRLGHISCKALVRRCERMCELFNAERLQDRSRLQAAFVGALNELWNVDHFERGERLSDFLDRRAVTIQSDGGGEGGTWWRKSRLRAGAKVIASEFARGGCDGWVGVEQKPIWLTPYGGEIERLCAEAKQGGLPQRERNRLAGRIRDKLGLYAIQPREGLLAFITREPLRKLLYAHDGKTDCLPVGPTAVEARGSLRFRPWPRPRGGDAFGRTYDLDPEQRQLAVPPRCHGAEEAVRPRMRIAEFAECIYIGDITASATDRDEQAFLSEIGAATSDSPTLLRQMAVAVDSCPS
ncbi:MAG TPA: hypothetical protein VF547_06290 [Allosphingosinicella sp.]